MTSLEHFRCGSQNAVLNFSFCSWFSPLFHVILGLIFFKLVAWLFLLWTLIHFWNCQVKLALAQWMFLLDFPQETQIFTKSNSKSTSTGRTQIYFWFCYSINDKMGFIETIFIHPSSFWPCFFTTLLLIQIITLHLPFTLPWRCFQENEWLPASKSAIIKAFHLKFLTTVLPHLFSCWSSYNSAYHHFNIYLFFKICLPPLLEIKHHVINNFCQFCQLLYP